MTPETRPDLSDPDRIEVIAFSLDCEATQPLEAGEGWLDEEERDRAERFRFGILRERYIRGRAMVRRTLAECLGRDPGSLEFEVGDRGKPYLRDGALHFNLSHSEELAVLAVSRLPSIGIDVEKFDREVDYDGLARRCFREAECERLVSLAGRDKAAAFFWTWTAKEARMKATGEGFGLEPTRIEIGFRGLLPDVCREPNDPRAWLSPVRLPGDEAACTVAALSPFRVSFREAEEWRAEA